MPKEVTQRWQCSRGEVSLAKSFGQFVEPPCCGAGAGAGGGRFPDVPVQMGGLRGGRTKFYTWLSTSHPRMGRRKGC